MVNDTRESKVCKAKNCGKTYYRTAQQSDFTWKKKRFCRYACRYACRYGISVEGEKEPMIIFTTMRLSSNK